MDTAQRDYIRDVLGVREVLLPETTEQPQAVEVQAEPSADLKSGVFFVIPADVTEAEKGLLQKIMSAAALPGQQVAEIDFNTDWLSEFDALSKLLVFSSAAVADSRVHSFPQLSAMLDGPEAQTHKKTVWNSLKQLKSELSQ